MTARSRDIAILGNPVSGGGKGGAVMAMVEAAARKRGLTPILLRTERAGHAVDLAAKAGGQVPRLLVAGGDGTLRDAVHGLLRAGALETTTVGIIPAGTGNDFIRTLGIPRDIAAATEVALGEATRAVDLWRWNESPFINLAGVGFDAAVAGAVNRRFKRLGGTLAYVAAVLVTLPRFQPPHLHLSWGHAEGETPGEWDGKAWLAAFGNGRCYGGGMQIAPAAEPDDRLLDLTVIGNLSRLELLRQFPTLFSGAHVRHPQVSTFRVGSVRLRAAPMDATIDGELIDRAPAEIALLPERVLIHVPG